MARLSAQAVRVGALEDGEGQLIFSDDALVAVLVRLSALHGAQAGQWFLEAAFGRLAPATLPAFDDLESAKAWIGERVPPEGRDGAARDRAGEMSHDDEHRP